MNSMIATNHEHKCVVVVQLKPTLQTLYNEVPSIFITNNILKPGKIH